MFIEKKGFNIKNGVLEKKFNIQMQKTQKGYNIVGYNNDKIINKHVRYMNKPNTLKKNKPKKKTKRKMPKK
jgi:hypothetical protein